jgi:hypothetical protein
MSMVSSIDWIVAVPTCVRPSGVSAFRREGHERNGMGTGTVVLTRAVFARRDHRSRDGFGNGASTLDLEVVGHAAAAVDHEYGRLLARILRSDERIGLAGSDAVHGHVERVPLLADDARR